MTAPFAQIDHAAQRVHITRGTWSASFPLSDLPRWIRFYQGQAKRAGGRFRKSYEPDVAALRSVQHALEAQPS